MGGRGKDNGEKDNSIPERFGWLSEVSSDRLRAYSARAGHVGQARDPQGRQIHVVGYYADKELQRRGES